MLGHYLRQAVRILRKQPLYATINVMGLSVALGVCVLIVLFVRDEFSYDNWHEKADRIVRLNDVTFEPDGTVRRQSAHHPYAMGPAFAREHPDVEEAVRFIDADVVLRDEGGLREATAMFADPNFFRVFDYQPVQGALEDALTDPASVVLTASAATRLLGGTQVVGKSIEVRFEDSFLPATVTAVVADPPSGTHLPFEVLMSFERLPLVYDWIARRVDRWNASSFPVYALLKEGTDFEAARATTSRLWKTFYPDMTERGREGGWWTGQGDPAGLDLVRLRDLHLRPDLTAAFVATSNPLYSWILLGIAGLILLLASINFTLLAIGQSAARASEIGVRKAIGARRGEIIAQFGGEALLMALFGLLGGGLLAGAFLPVASTLSGKNLKFDLLAEPLLLAVLVLVALATGLTAGIYPALVASRHQPSETMRGRFRLSGSGGLSRLLLVIQFGVSVALVSGALAMKAQLDHIQSQDVGYDADQVIVVATRGLDGYKLRDYLESELGSRADIESVAGISLSLNRGYSSTSWMAGGVERQAYEYIVDTDVFDLLRMEVVAGRSFSADRASDSSAVVVNAAFASDWGWSPQEAIGKRIAGRDDEPEIIGVLANANLRSLHSDVAPAMFLLHKEWFGYMLIRPVPGQTESALAAVRTAWQAFTPEVPFSYTFLDDDVALAYENDLRWARIVRYAAGLAILVACLGLFGLAALTVSRRTKEIGIRKVLGASVSDVALLVSRDFALIVGMATLVAGPLAWWGLQRWLDGFAYRISLSVWLFAAAGGLVLAVALATVAYHATRAALADPVQSLRYE